MKLADRLTTDTIAVSVSATSLADVVGTLARRVTDADGSPIECLRDLPRALAEGERGELIRVNDTVLLALARVQELEDLTVGLAVAATPFPVLLPYTLDEGEQPAEHEPAGTAQAVVLLLTPRRLATLKAQVIPALSRVLRDDTRTARLLGARTPIEIRAFRELMDVELNEKLLVEDALTPLTYRVYGDATADEVIDLVARRGLRAVAVVGENYEVLGIITSGDLLKHLLPLRRAGESKRPTELDAAVTARDIMSRQVMCISEEQSLLEAANMMVNRDVEQLPVVREGELIGFVTRGTTLKMLFG